MKSIRKKIINLPLRHKIFLIIILVNIFLFGVISIPCINIVINAYTKSLYQSIAESLSYSSMEIQRSLDTSMTMSNLMFADEAIQSELSVLKSGEAATGDSYKHLYETLQTYYLEYKKNNLSYVSLYNSNFEIRSYSTLAVSVPDEVSEDIRNQALKADGRALWITDYCQDYGLYLSRSIRRIENLQLDSLGILTICIDVDKIVTSSTSFRNQYATSSYIILDNNSLIYHSKNISEKESLQLSRDLTSSYEVITLDNHKFFAVKGLIPNYNWDYICLVPFDSINDSVHFAYLIYLAVLGLGILISSIFSTILIKALTKHFDNLVNKMKSFSKSDTTLLDVGYDYSDREDEFGILHRQFDNMANEIQELITVNYTNKLLMKDAQIKALETQINPHFLYNTLESVNWRAKAIKATNISLMVESLGNLLRMTLSSKTENYTLEQELKLIDSYMTIQQLRYEDRLIYSIQVDQSLLNARIPKLTIQPLVENSINHALEEMTEECHINVSAILNDNNLEIYIKNNGSQFEDELLSKLIHGEYQPRGLGIGLQNIHQRFQLTFGEEYGLSLYNETEYAVARIIIPYTPI